MLALGEFPTMKWARYDRGMLDPAVLKGSYLVAGLDDVQIQSVASLAELKHYASGHLLAKIGEAADVMFVVIGGNLTVTTHDGDKLGEIATGSVVGEIALVDARPRAANVVCVGPVSVAVFPVDKLRMLMNQNRDMGFLMLANIARVLAARLRNADAIIDQLADGVGDVWTNALG
ncbi:MAG: cyclic nucleotide-binding domain-containing protein [Fimbriimonadaceae bacterium]